MRHIFAPGLRFAALLVGTSALAAVQAQAQSVTPQDGGNEASDDSETSVIIVTAQRRDQNLQDVAMTVSVTSGDDLQGLALTDFKDVQQLTPGLELSNNDGRRNVATIRGISYEPDSGASPAVDIYINNIPVDAQTVFGAIYDVGQIEVLRGPQGVFRGRTSPAGAITLTTRRANLDEPEGYAQLLGTTRDAVNGQFGVSVPLVPGKLAVRFAALGDFNRGGQVTRLDGDKSSLTTMSGRVSIAFAPTERFRADLTYQYFWSDTTPYRAVFGPGNTPFIGFGDTTRTGPELTLEDRTSIGITTPRFLNRTHLVTLATEFEITDDITWAVDAGYQATNAEQVYPSLDSEVSIPGVAQPTRLTFPPKTLTIDTRVFSDGPQAFNWMVGLFHQRFRANSTLFEAPSDFLLGTPGGPFPLSSNLFGSGLPNPVPATAFLEIPASNDTTAVFGSVRFDLTDSLRFEAGLRYTNYTFDQQSFFTFSIPLFGPSNPVNQPAYTPEVAQRENNVFTGGATLSFDINPDLTTYFSYGRARRVPFAQNGAALSGTTNVALLLSPDEKSDAFEVGLKGNLLDRRLNFGLTAFYQKFDNFVDYIPGLNIRGPSGITTIPVSTGGDATSKGIEFQLDGRVTDNFDLSVSGAYIVARYDDAVVPGNTFDASGAATIPVGQDFSTITRNDRLAQVPDFTATVTGEYRIPIGEHTPFIRTLVSYRPGFESTFDNFDYRTFTNASLFVGVRGPSDRWEVSVFARNLLDQTRALRVSDQQLQKGTVLFDFVTNGAPSLSGYRSAVISNPREFGITTRFSW